MRVLTLLPLLGACSFGLPTSKETGAPPPVDSTVDSARETARPDSARETGAETDLPDESAPPPDTGWDPDDDSDRDGISDGTEGRADPESVDTDADGTPDYLDDDSDADGLADEDEGEADWDGDGAPNWRDPTNDSALSPVRFVAISTDFNSPIGIDFHESAYDVVMSVNYSSGSPHALETVASNGAHSQFSTLAGVTDEVKIATVRSGGLGGFEVGELFVGNGVDGQIVRVSADGSTVTNPWVDLPGASNGLMRGSLYVDRTGVFGGNLLVATTVGQVWSIDAAGNATQLADLGGVHLEGLVTVPDAPARYGPLAGTVLAGAESQGLLYSIAPDGTVNAYDVDVAVEDIEIVEPYENFFGINFGTSSLLGAGAEQFLPMAGDILLTQESVTAVGLFRLWYDGSALRAEELQATSDSARISQWEHVTFANAGIQEVP